MKKTRNVAQDNLKIFAIISIIAGFYTGTKFDDLIQIPISVLAGLVTFALCMFFENMILRFLTSIEQRQRLKKIFGDPEEEKSKAKKKLKDKLKGLKGEQAINYSKNKFPAWMRHFIPGGYVGENLLRANLAAAGINDYPIHKYVALKIIAIIVVGFFGYKMIPGWIGIEESSYLLIVQAICTVVGSVSGWFMVDRWITEKGRERATKVAMGLPDAVDILTIYVSAGVLFDVALAESYEALKKINKEIALEFRKLAEDMNISQDRAAALDEFLHRCDNPSVREFVSIVKQALRDGSHGSPMSDSFRKLSGILRKERALLIEKKAAKIPTVLILPQIVIMLPCVVVLTLFSTVYDLIGTLGTLVGG